jgi:hypothetical protein
MQASRLLALARLHFQGDYISISKNCAQQGHSLVLLNNHFSSLGSLDGIQDLSQFNIPDHITNISDEYRAAWGARCMSKECETKVAKQFQLKRREGGDVAIKIR